MRIVFYDHLALEFPDEIAALRERVRQLDAAHEIVVLDPAESDIVAEIADADLLVAGRIPDDAWRAADALKYWLVPFAGVNWLPEDVSERGVRVANSHGNAPVVAERAVGLLLAAAGRIVEFDAAMRKGQWSRRQDEHRPFEYWTSIKGKTIAYIGAGQIARETRTLLAGFGCRHIACRRRPEALHGFDYTTTDIHEALDMADAAIVGLPLTPDTRDAIGPTELDALGTGVLVNVSRGEVVNEEALYTALRDGRLLAAGIDTWYQYPKPFWTDAAPSRYDFAALPSVVMSPHAASHAVQGKVGQLSGTIENLISILRTGNPVHEAHPELGY